MKAIQTKTKASEPAQKSGPFFKKDPGQGFFHPIQTKLTVNKPDDAYEREADATADRVVSRKPIFDSKRDPEDGVQRKCAECEQEEQVQKKGKGAAGSSVSSAVESGISSSKGGGAPLPKGARSQMESSFGTDFSGVRIHQDSGAQQMNKALNAQAFTHGKDIYFDSGKYNPDNDEGKHLLAHELTHVVQQTGGGKQAVRRKVKPAAAHAKTAAQAMGAGHAAGAGHSPGSAQATGAPLPVIEMAGKEEGMAEPGPGLMGPVAGLPAIQRAPPPPPTTTPPNCGSAPAGTVPIADVTANCPTPLGKIEKNGNDVTLTMNEVKVKENADTDFLNKTLTWPRVLPKSGSRKDNPTQQVPMWNKLVQTAVENKLKSYIDKINTAQTLDNKIADANMWSLSMKPGKGQGIAALLGNFKSLVAQCLRPKWSPLGAPQAFQVEHIVDYQIADKDADNDNNLMLLSAAVNNRLGQDMAKYIADNIQDILDHYNKFVKPGDLATGAQDARKNYTIKANKPTPVKPDIPADTAILKEDMNLAANAAKNPLQEANIELKAFSKAPDGYFVLKTNDTSAGIVLPYHQTNYNVGSYLLTLNGSEAAGIKEFKATLQISGPAVADKPKEVTYPVETVNKESKIFRVRKFGYPGSIMKINYLSDVTFEDPEVDDEMNLTMKGTIKTPTPKFLNATPIEVLLSGRDLSLQQTFSPAQLGNVGPIKVDNADLTLSLSTKNGFGAAGSVDFSLPGNVAKGHIEASADKTGFNLGGKLQFTTKTFDQASIEVTYASGKDKEGSNPWTIKGVLTIGGAKVKGIDKASITVAYDGKLLTLNGSASLSVPGVKSVSIDSKYGVDTGAFELVLTTQFDFKSKFIKEPKITVKLATGTGDDGGGLKLGVSGTMVLAIPHLDPATITVAYDDGDFIAFVDDIGINIGTRIHGTLSIGVTNRKVDEATGLATGKGSGKDVVVYGQGTITVTVNDNIKPSVTIKLTPAGKILVSAEIKVVQQPLMPGDKLLGNTYPIFDLATPEIPIFSVGVGSIFLQIKGQASAMYQVDVPKLDFTLSMKDKDIFDPKDMSFDVSVSPSIAAEAGLDFSVTFLIGAKVLVLRVHADITGTLKLHAKAIFAPKLNLSWSPEKGLTLKDAEIALNAVIEASGEIKGAVVVDLNLFIKTIELWRHEWTLAEMKLGDLGNIGVTFPIKFDQNGNIIPQDKLKPETPLSDKANAEKTLGDKAGGGNNEVQRTPDFYKVEMTSLLQSLPAIGPTNPQYSVQRGRHEFMGELAQNYPTANWDFLRTEWAALEYGEYLTLANKLRQPVSDKNGDKMTQLQNFARDHTTVPQTEIDTLAGEIRKMEQPQ